MKTIKFIKRQLTEELVNENSQSLFIEGCDSAIIGLTEGGNFVYSYLELIELHIQANKKSEENESGFLGFTLRDEAYFATMFEANKLNGLLGKCSGVPIICMDDEFLESTYLELPNLSEAQFQFFPD